MHEEKFILQHHGIKGMRWGVRRFQKKNGVLTAAGKKRYNDNDPPKSESKVKEKSKHRLKLEEGYRKAGLNKKQAELEASKRIKTEKILATAAGLTVTACAAYVVHKKLKDRCDGIIKAGEALQRVEMTDTGGKLHDVFYVSKGKHDNKRYAGMLGFTRQKQTGKAFLMKLESENDIRVASKDKAAKIFGDLYKNDGDFRSAVEGHVKQHFRGFGVNKADPTNVSKRNINKMYENFNSGLVFMQGEGHGADKKFYNKLKEAGYGAIQDINDMKYSGYNARNPLIVFDNSKGNIMTKSVKQLDAATITVKGRKEYAKALGEGAVKSYMPLLAMGITGATVKTHYEDPETQLYRQGKK